jgi:hypothetical protein
VRAGEAAKVAELELFLQNKPVAVKLVLRQTIRFHYERDQ